MAQTLSTLCLQAVRAAARGLVTLAFWTLWLVLVLLLAAQMYIASTNELPVPRFVQRALEDRLALSGIHASFGRSVFDPSGRVLIENVRITLPGFEDSVVTARAIYARLDPWALLADRFEPLDLRVTGVSLRVPAMLSPSGRADEIVSDLDAAFLPRGDEVTVEYCNCHLGPLAVSVDGAVRLGSAANKGRAPLPIAEFLAQSYGQLSREGAMALNRLGAFDQPFLRAHLAPSEPDGATARCTLGARGLRLDSPVAVEATALQVDGVVSLGGAAGAPTDLVLTAENVSLPRWGAVTRGLRARLRGSAAGRAASGRPALALQEVEATAATVTGLGQTLSSPILVLRGTGSYLWSELQPAQFGPVRAALQTVLWDQPISAQAEVDFRRRTATGRFTGAAGPGVLDALGAHWHKDFHPYAALAAPVRLDGEAHLDPGWKFAGVSAWISAQGVTFKGVRVDEIRGRVGFDGRRIVAPEAFARIGDDDARGSYEMDVATKDYHYLLDGRLRPLDITPWINGAWWKPFFGNFAFPSAPPTASVDLRGCYINPRKLVVLVFFDGADTAIRGVSFDRVRTRLFIRPQFDDGLDFTVNRGAGVAGGTFVRRFDFDRGAASFGLDFAATSTLDPGPIIREAGALFPPSLAVYAFAQPPTLKLSGHLDGPAAPGGQHLAVHIDARTAGEFRYQDFPFDGAAAQVDVNDGDVTLPQVSAGFAGGSLSGHARVWGQAADRRLSFAGSLTGANLGTAITTLEAFSARRAHQPPPPLRDYLKEKSDLRLDLSASAEGRLADPFSYQGGGTLAVQGAELGELKMLGLLSNVLPFTSLRFTSARAAFKIDGARLIFPSVSVIGANSAITANGTYALEHHLLDFRAKIQPFQKSTSLPQIFMGAVLTPFSTLLEVKLTGTIEKPAWAMANGPFNLLRNLGPSEADKTAPAVPLSPLKDH